jgi:hypothetical protein
MPNINKINYECPKCNKKLSSKQRLEIHTVSGKCDVKYTCVKCNKEFPSNTKLVSHLNRKTSCEIEVGVVPEMVIDNQCKFCFKKFYDKSTKIRHEESCKVKNTEKGMELLMQKITEIQKQQEEQKQEMQTLRERNEELLLQIKNNEQKANIVIENNGIIANNIIINSYDDPKYDFLIETDKFHEIYRENLIDTPVQLIPHIWFNEEYPENLSIYVQNVHGIVLVYKNGKWKTTPKTEIVDTLRNRAYAITDKLLSDLILKKIVNRQDILHKIRWHVTDKEIYTYDIARIDNLLNDSGKLAEKVYKSTKN